MALATYKPTVLARETPQDSSVVAEPRKHEIYDHKETPLWSLDAFLSGSPWQVTYFRQRLGRNDTPKKLDPNSSPAYQSYEKIERLDILVQTALSASFNDKEQVMMVTGSATIYSFLTPNVDDYFIATANLARLGLFRITNVSRRTFERESVHIVEYTEEKELTDQDIEYQDLMKKVTATYVFSKQRLIENLNPLLLKHTYDRVQNLRALYENLVRRYFDSFFQVSAGTLIVPGQVGSHYDPFVVGFINQIVSTYDAPQLQRMHSLSVNNDPSFKVDHFWSLMAQRGLENLPYVNRTMGKLCPRDFVTAYFSVSGNFSNADYIVSPVNADASAQSMQSAAQPLIVGPVIGSLDYVRTKTFGGGQLEASDAVYPDLVDPLPVYTPIHTLTTYVFPASFYAGQKHSLIEVLTMDYLARAPLNLDMLLFMVSYYPKLERLEQFYFGPILMVLLKEADRGAYA